MVVFFSNRFQRISFRRVTIGRPSRSVLHLLTRDQAPRSNGQSRPIPSTAAEQRKRKKDEEKLKSRGGFPLGRGGSLLMRRLLGSSPKRHGRDDPMRRPVGGTWSPAAIRWSIPVDIRFSISPVDSRGYQFELIRRDGSSCRGGRGGGEIFFFVFFLLFLSLSSVDGPRHDRWHVRLDALQSNRPLSCLLSIPSSWWMAPFSWLQLYLCVIVGFIRTKYHWLVPSRVLRVRSFQSTVGLASTCNSFAYFFFLPWPLFFGWYWVGFVIELGFFAELNCICVLVGFLRTKYRWLVPSFVLRVSAFSSGFSWTCK